MPMRDGSSKAQCLMAGSIHADAEPEGGIWIDYVLVHLCNSLQAQSSHPISSRPIPFLWLMLWESWEVLGRSIEIPPSLSC